MIVWTCSRIEQCQGPDGTSKRAGWFPRWTAKKDSQAVYTMGDTDTCEKLAEIADTGPKVGHGSSEIIFVDASIEKKFGMS